MNSFIPLTMKAVQLDEPGGKLVLREVEAPRPKVGQVLVRMAAAPINPSDIGSILGYSYRGDRVFPYTPGLEGSGTVVEAGEGLMPRLLNGRRVACSAQLTGDGTWAEYMVTSAQLCIPLSKHVTFEQGAMLLVNPLTALAIVEIVQKNKHKAIVSTAAASALGGMILRLGARHNIPIIHIVRRQEQVEIVQGRGGSYVLNSSEPDFEEELQKLAKKLKATLILDAIGGKMTGTLAETAPYGSTILLYSRLAGKDSVVNPRTAFVKHLRLEGWFLANWLQGKNLLQILLLSRKAQSLVADDLQSPIHKRLPISAAQEGLEVYMNNMSAGKILLVADSEEVGG